MSEAIPVILCFSALWYGPRGDRAITRGPIPGGTKKGAVWKMRQADDLQTDERSGLGAIRKKCLGCCEEVRLCPAQSCSLWVYRMGTDPNRAGHHGGFARPVEMSEAL